MMFIYSFFMYQPSNKVRKLKTMQTEEVTHTALSATCGICKSTYFSVGYRQLKFCVTIVEKKIIVS